MSIYFKDDFNDNSLDGSKWQQYGALALLVEQNKRLETTQADGTIAIVESVNSYSIAGKSFQCETWANKQTDAVNYLFLLSVHRAYGAPTNQDTIIYDCNAWKYYINGVVGVAWDTAPPTYNQDRKYLLEIRYSADGGTVYFYIDKVLRKTAAGVSANAGIITFATKAKGRFDNAVIQDVAEAS